MLHSSSSSSTGNDIAIEMEDVGVVYQAAQRAEVAAVKGLNLTVAHGEFVAIIGPSGCGKSTTLHCMGGLQKATAGRVLSGGVVVEGPDATRAAFVFQDYTLLPWLSIIDNVALGLNFRGEPKSARRKVAQHQLESVRLDHVADRFPGELSGGMQQRVAVARALAMDPSILLLDEPFGALDEQTRRTIGLEMARVLTETGKTVVLVTHSIDEALFWADRVLLMNSDGELADVIEVEGERPRSLDFMTTPEFGEARARIFEWLVKQHGDSAVIADE